MIEFAKKRDGLYYLQESNRQTRAKNLPSLSFLCKSVETNKDKIWLQHYSHGHLSPCSQNYFTKGEI